MEVRHQDARAEIIDTKNKCTFKSTQALNVAIDTATKEKNTADEAALSEHGHTTGGLQKSYTDSKGAKTSALGAQKKTYDALKDAEAESKATLKAAEAAALAGEKKKAEVTKSANLARELIHAKAKKGRDLAAGLAKTAFETASGDAASQLKEAISTVEIDCKSERTTLTSEALAVKKIKDSMTQLTKVADAEAEEETTNVKVAFQVKTPVNIAKMVADLAATAGVPEDQIEAVSINGLPVKKNGAPAVFLELEGDGLATVVLRIKGRITVAQLAKVKTVEKKAAAVASAIVAAETERSVNQYMAKRSVTGATGSTGATGGATGATGATGAAAKKVVKKGANAAKKGPTAADDTQPEALATGSTGTTGATGATGGAGGATKDTKTKNGLVLSEEERLGATGATGATGTVSGGDGSELVHPEPAIVAEDCKMSMWMKKNGCSKTCGGGDQIFVRKVTHKPANGGKACPADARKTEVCNDNACPVDCEVGQWVNAGKCSLTCGGGSQKRTRAVVVQAQHGGAKCPALTDSADCNEDDCPVHCVMTAWKSHGECTKTCGGGDQEFVRSVKTPPSGGGKACPASIKEFRDCNTAKCNAEDCELSGFKAKAECSVSCGGGKQTFERVVTKAANYGGTCGQLSEVRDCNTEACPINCQVSGFRTGGKCSATCGGGKLFETRVITVQPMHGGAKCPAKMTRSVNCNEQPCPVNCKVTAFVKVVNQKCNSCWDGSAIGAYDYQLKRTVLVQPKHGGAACPALEQRQNCRSEVTRRCTYDKETRYTSGASSGTDALAQQNDMVCNDGTALQKFRLWKSGNNIKYLYTCVQAEEKTAAKRKLSTQQTSRGNSIHYLDRQNVQCDASGVMTDFAMKRHQGCVNRHMGTRDVNCGFRDWTYKCDKENIWHNDCHDNMSYDYHCLGSSKPSNAKKTALKFFNANQIGTIDKHVVECGTNQAVSQFKLNMKALDYFGVMKNVQYEYRCSELGSA